MSGHLIGCAGSLETYSVDGTERKLPTSHKLALLAYADSADDRTHIGFAGYKGVMAWAVCSRARAAELIRDLCSWGLLEQHATARPGRRAEYVVFPGGCCDIHRPAEEEPAHDIGDLARAAGISVDQARLLVAAMNGSDAPDTSPRNGSDAPDPLTADTSEQAVEPVDSHTFETERVQNRSDTPDPFTTSTTSPLPPPASRQGRCGAHPNGHANCRGCGTTPRQLAAAAAKAKADKQRANAQAQVERDRQAAATARAAYPTSVVRAARAAVAPAPKTRTRTKEWVR
ncbi:hypothetical protein [Nocardioides sp.]|uniref:hypothetical protein n=1 Tax=Nocardioides sp. TaxID=35761 RepID=UPI002CC117A4|nr:hypothetical protein [Nocardioides sp.]HXH77291.1 hypothetical protein [Nocardioides sp.]